MEVILEQVKRYDIPELRKKLIENGVDVGPISSYSISLFQRRLATRLFELQGGKLEEDDGEKKKVDERVQIVETKTNDSLTKCPDVYYAICLPDALDPEVKKEVNQLVFSDKELALKTAKKIKNARFKMFKSKSDAQEFSRLTAETAFNSPRKLQSHAEEKEQAISTESSPYKSPKPQEIVVLRKAIESGNVGFFKSSVWENPRYLVGSGDTPVIYQEGFRYTAMHVAAMKNKPEVCQVILDIIENPAFITQLYSQSKHTEETQNSRINFLVDLYLNMPDKGNCESPLHMACKFGHDKVVEVLICHPKTDRTRKNKWGDSPREIICSRCSGATTAQKERIEMLLEGQSYVPLMRSDDNSTAPVIGQPWSPDKNSPLQKIEKTWSPKDPSMAVKAYAGPMSPSNARNFHKRWTTPPSQSPDQTKKYFDIKRSDCEKGLERIGRQLAHEMKIPWLEHWDFLNAYIDLSCENGLDHLENYFEKSIWLEYVKTFKDKYGLNENTNMFVTPLKREKQVTKGGYSDEFSSKRNNEEISEKNNNIQGGGKEKTNKDICEKTVTSEPEKQSTGNTVVSPMTSLAQSFAQIKLFNDSSSDEATINSTNQSFGDDKTTLSEDAEQTHDEIVTINTTRSFLDEKSNDQTESQAQKQSIVEPKDNSIEASSMKVVEHLLEDKPAPNKDLPESVSIEQQKGGGGSDHNKNGSSMKNESTVNEAKLDPAKVNIEESENAVEDVLTVKKTELLKQRSCSSESADSFKTTLEDTDEPDVAAFHDLDEVDKHVCINVSDSSVIDQLKEYLHKHTCDTDTDTSARFIVRLKSTSVKPGLKIDIISILDSDLVSCVDLLVLEDVAVSSCEGDIGGTDEGEIVEIGTGRTEPNELPVHAYLSRTVTLPKVAYLYGPQPTREDLDVSRALEDAIIVPDLYPNVFQWKIKLSRFLRDTNYRWQSPAKVRTKFQWGSPQPSPLRKTSPILQYGSPLGLRSQQRITASADIRTKLFPSIAE